MDTALQYHFKISASLSGAEVSIGKFEICEVIFQVVGLLNPLGVLRDRMPKGKMYGQPESLRIFDEGRNESANSFVECCVERKNYAGSEAL